MWRRGGAASLISDRPGRRPICDVGTGLSGPGTYWGVGKPIHGWHVQPTSRDHSEPFRWTNERTRVRPVRGQVVPRCAPETVRAPEVGGSVSGGRGRMRFAKRNPFRSFTVEADFCEHQGESLEKIGRMGKHALWDKGGA